MYVCLYMLHSREQVMHFTYNVRTFLADPNFLKELFERLDLVLKLRLELV